MSISAEEAQKMKNEVAVGCCRTEAGTVISAKNLEDPAIIPDLVDSNLLEIPDNCLKIGEVIGAKLKETVDSLTPFTPEMFEDIKKMEEDEDIKLSNEDQAAVLKINKKAGEKITIDDLEDPMHFDKLEDSLLIDLNDSDNVLSRREAVGKTLSQDLPALTPIKKAVIKEYPDSTTEEGGKSNQNNVQRGGVLKIKIDEGKGIDIELPLNTTVQGGAQTIAESNQSKSLKIKDTADKEKKAEEEIIVRKLKRKYFEINEVKFARESKIEDKTLYIRKDICQDAVDSEDLVVDLKIDIITPDDYDKFSNTIMDVQPIAVKEEGELGEGITRVIDGVIVMVTGTDEEGVQIGEFGSSEGILERNIMWGRPGAPEKGEIFIKTDVKVKAGTGMERPGPMAAHKATDFITQEIREVLKELDESLKVREEEFVQKRRPGKKKVAIIKEIMGQGAMHDNYLLPVEPVGTLGAKANVDLGNVPIVVSPLQVIDGCIHALTCIGPASKETSRHYWREPLVMEAMNDDEIDLTTVILIGSPQVNSEKFYVSKLLGMAVESMDLDGAIVTTEGFGNNHVDFASNIEQVGKRGVPVVGVTYAAVQGQLVVGNEYMDAMVDLNKSRQGIENEILENNCLTKEDAIRAIAMLKSKVAGEEIKAPERSWNPNVKLNNIEVIEDTLGEKIELAPNETSLKMSKKRKEIYEKDEKDN
ncbi:MULTISPECIES: D-proline reductase (dithiol) proprotein PrdA [unclassified Halanaerobium]|uniref:D-proline reductase (dithiol) proprotein PrdA n=1 Tax=unclassified Halanaerobium TaxID=2641197 RepID=UPI000DF261AF|nr:MULTISPECIES: D-proline reductase (dithiol) proprotein PrdA [unclassified Halanaerobium]RCW47382.1 D-proline reductase (dithiol) PrdA [Halanaerobium sp. MA284_MarDTE_T2]RCW84921.1 D-proline reductase (dithiol) PrdA [Halanaerobium sp. DL-01]